MTVTTRERRPRTGHGLAAGARTALPQSLAFLPFGLVIGAAADQARINDLLGWSTAWVTYAGTVQLIVIEMLDSGGAPIAAFGAIVLINLRLIAYATALSTDWRGAPLWWRALASYLLVDPAYALTVDRKVRSPRPTDAGLRAFYLGAAGTLWGTWLVYCGLGVTLGSYVASVVPTRTLADLMLVSMLAMICRDLGTRAAAVTALALGVPALALPGGSGPTAASVLAVAAAAALSWRRLP